MLKNYFISNRSKKQSGVNFAPENNFAPCDGFKPNLGNQNFGPGSGGSPKEVKNGHFWPFLGQNRKFLPLGHPKLWF